MSVIPLYVKAKAEREPDAPFSTFLSRGKVQSISFRMLYEGGCAYAREYIRLGINPGDIVLIILGHSPHLFFSFLGATLAAAIPSFMPFPSAKQRSDLYWIDLQRLLRRIEPALIVSYAANVESARDGLQEIRARFLVADDDILTRPVDRNAVDMPGLRAQPDDTFCLQHSSGTTGLKKGVILTHRVVLQHIDAYCKAIDFSILDRIVSWLPLYHDMGFIACFVLSLVRGSHLIALDPLEWSVRPKILLDAIRSYRATLCWMPNFAFSHIVRATRANETYDLHSMRAFINCSEPCKTSTVDRFVRRFSHSGIDASKIGVCYAMAENVFAVTQTELGIAAPRFEADSETFSAGAIVPSNIGRPSKSFAGCGTPVNGVEYRISCVDARYSKSLRIGEIHVSGDSLFGGYYRQADVTRERVTDGWYATGDLGFVEAGQLFITGRTDDLIILNGRNYYAHDLELLLADIAEIVPGRVVVIDAEDPVTDAAGLVVLAEFSASTADTKYVFQAIRQAISDTTGLAVHRIVSIPARCLIKTSSGKLDRRRNKEMYFNDYASSEAVIPK